MHSLLVALVESERLAFRDKLAKVLANLHKRFLAVGRL